MSLTCLEFRQRVGAEPACRDPAVLAHRRHCPACAAFADAQLALDARLEAALHIHVPEDLGARIIWNQANRRRIPLRTRRGLAIGAGLAAAFALAAGLGISMARFSADESFGREVVEHIEHEPARLAWPPGTPAARAVQVSAVLDHGGVRYEGPLDDVMSAGLCPFRGRSVPHLVMRVNGEAVSVLLLPGEPVRATREIHEDGYHGVLIPHDAGSIAIVAPRADLVRPLREELERAVHWQL